MSSGLFRILKQDSKVATLCLLSVNVMIKNSLLAKYLHIYLFRLFYIYSLEHKESVKIMLLSIDITGLVAGLEVAVKNLLFLRI